MYKKVSSIVLALLLCLSSVSAVYADASDSHVTNAPSAGMEQPVAVNNDQAADASTDTSAQDAAAVNPPLHLITTVDNPAFVERMYRVDEETLALPTAELLEYFINSQLVRETISQEGLSSTVGPSSAQLLSIEYTYHDAFCELLTREDFADALEDCAQTLLAENEVGLFTDMDALVSILEQSSMQVLVSGMLTSTEGYESIKTVAATRGIGDSAGSLN